MGELFREGESRPATQEDLALYERTQSLQALQQVPVLHHADKPHEYLFFAMFDGTGQDADNPKQQLTNVGHLYKQSEELARNPENRIGYKYVEGIGTQDNSIARGYDGLVAHTWDDKIEKAYRALAEQTRKWQQQDPEAQVRVADVGYSRGAVLAAGLSRLVDQYGIADPEGLKFGRDAHGHISVESPRLPLVQSGQAAQALAMFDPVATGMPVNFDARPAPSVISRFALAAADEQRKAFDHQTIVAPGISGDGRSVNALVPGGHSNVGGGNSEPGLEAGAFNVMADYLNGLRDKPVFAYRPLPDDPALYTVYQARGPTAVPGLDRDGRRDLRAELASCKIVDPCRDAEPVNETLAAQFEYRPLQPSAPTPRLALVQQPTERDQQPSAQSPSVKAPSDPTHPDHELMEKLQGQVRGLDQQAGKGWDENSERLAASALVVARRMGFTAHDDLRLTFNDASQRHAAGELLFVSRQGTTASPDPAANLAYMPTAEALSKPAQNRYQEVESINQTQVEALRMAQQQAVGLDDPARSGPVR